MSEVHMLFPHQGGYRWPNRVDDYRTSPGTARATGKQSVVEQAHAAIVYAQNEFQKHIDSVDRRRGDYTPDAWRARVTSFTASDAAAAVDAAVAKVTERADEAATQVYNLRRDLSPHGDTAAEMRAGRYWGRTQRILDNIDNAKLFGAAQNLITEADRAELGVLLEELPAYFKSRGQPNDWLDTAVGQAVPEYGAAQTQLAKAQQARTMVEYNAKALRQGFTNGRPPSVLADPARYDPDR